MALSDPRRRLVILTGLQQHRRWANGALAFVPDPPEPPARGHAPDTYWVSLPSRRVLPVSWRHLVVIEDIDLLTYIFHSAVHDPHSSAVRPPRTARTLQWCLLPPHSPRLWLCQDPACLTLVSSDRHCCHTCGLSALASAFLRTRLWLSGLGIPQGAAAPLPPLAEVPVPTSWEHPRKWHSDWLAMGVLAQWWRRQVAPSWRHPCVGALLP